MGHKQALRVAAWNARYEARSAHAIASVIIWRDNVMFDPDVATGASLGRLLTQSGHGFGAFAGVG